MATVVNRRHIAYSMLVTLLWDEFLCSLSVEVHVLFAPPSFHRCFHVVITFKPIASKMFLEHWIIISLGNAEKYCWLAVTECGYALSCTSRTPFWKNLGCSRLKAVCKRVSCTVNHRIDCSLLHQVYKQNTFVIWRNISPPSSWSKSKPSQKLAVSKLAQLLVLVSGLDYFSTLKMEAIYSSKSQKYFVCRLDATSDPKCRAFSQLYTALNPETVLFIVTAMRTPNCSSPLTEYHCKNGRVQAIHCFLWSSVGA
jgi:hypothetical protein